MDYERLARSRADIENRVERFQKLQEQFNTERETYCLRKMNQVRSDLSPAPQGQQDSRS